jgi:branched-chain amino acid transport system substrate-binding protein
MRKLLILLILVGLVLAGCSGSAIEGVGTEPVATEDVADEPTAAPAPTEPEMEEEEPTAAPTAEPVNVKIGVLNPQTGGLAAFGAEVDKGIQLYFDSIDYTIDDNITVELTFADTAASPEQALEQARRLVEQEEVDFLLGIVSSSVAVPLAQYADEAQVPLVVTVAGGTPVITGPDRSPYVFRTSITTGQLEPILGWYTATELGYDRAVVFAPDFSAGHSRAGAFVEAYTAAGGEVVAEIFPPRGTTDYGPFIGQFDPEDVDVIYAYFFGSEAIAFVQQLNEFGVTPGKPVVSPGFLTEAEVLPAMGDAALGIMSATHYAPVLDFDANETFVEINEGAPPGTYLESGYLGAQVVAEAIAAVEGDLSDPQPFLDALAATDLASPSGPFSFDERGQSVRNLYIIQVVQDEDGDYTHEVIDVIEGITQDWTP